MDKDLPVFIHTGSIPLNEKGPTNMTRVATSLSTGSSKAETKIVTVLPWSAVPPAGIWSTTVPFGSTDVASTRTSGTNPASRIAR